MTNREKLIILAKLYMLKNTTEGQLLYIRDELEYTPKFLVEKAIKSVDNFIEIMEKVLTPDSIETAYDSCELIEDVLDIIIKSTEGGYFDEFKKSIKEWKR